MRIISSFISIPLVFSRKREKIPENFYWITQIEIKANANFLFIRFKEKYLQKELIKIVCKTQEMFGFYLAWIFLRPLIVLLLAIMLGLQKKIKTISPRQKPFMGFYLLYRKEHHSTLQAASHK